MNNINQLWQTRVQAYFQELRRYMKYMFNDHLLFVFIFGGGAAIFYYSQWVKTLDASFPIALVMALIFGVLLSISPIITLLKEADLVFIITLESKLDRYFRKGMQLSFLSQSYILLFLLAASMPMYVHVTGNGFSWFIYLLILIFALKIWNIAIHWLMMKLLTPYFYDWLIRFFFNFLFIYFIVDGASFWFIGTILLLLIAFTIYLREATKHKTIRWELLIEKEQGRMQNFYRVANMFTDVPHLRGRVKRRRWLDPIFAYIPHASEQTYRFLFSRTIVRTSEYSGLVVRLTVISGIVLILSNNLYLSLAITILFLYLTGFQLFPMLHKHDFKIWTSLYPISQEQKQTAFFSLLLNVLIVQGLLFGICAWIAGGLLHGVIIAGLSFLFALFFAKVYAPRRIKKLEQF